MTVISIKRLSRKELRIGQLLYPERGYWRPQTRGECVNVPRPCPFVGCKWHLYLDVDPRTGSIKLNFPDREVWQLERSCALDIADRRGETLEEVAAAMGLSDERIRQIEAKGLRLLGEELGE